MKPIGRFSGTGSLILLLSLAIGLPGCSNDPYEGPQRVAVQGNVTLDDEPVDGGTVNFIALDGENRNTSGSIRNGTYEIPEERGPNPGNYRVQIYWHKPLDSQPKQQSTDSDEANDADPPSKQVIPEKYNKNSTLEVEITPSGGKEGGDRHDFTLTSK